MGWGEGDAGVEVEDEEFGFAFEGAVGVFVLFEGALEAFDEDFVGFELFVDGCDEHD